LNRSSASSLDVIEISIVVSCVMRSAACGVCVRQRRVTRIVPKRRCWCSGQMEACRRHSGFTALGVRRQS
jgi:hypothetical protein